MNQLTEKDLNVPAGWKHLSDALWHLAPDAVVTSVRGYMYVENCHPELAATVVEAAFHTCQICGAPGAFAYSIVGGIKNPGPRCDVHRGWLAVAV